MTEKLYDKDSHLKEFEGTVLSCEKIGEKYAIVLNQTAFFPEGGGQQSDRGYAGDAYIADVQIKNGVILHFADKPLSIGQAYKCKIDFDFRFRNMQNHSGEHIISGIVHKLYGFNNVGFHLGTEMTVDFDGELTRRQLDEVEVLAVEHTGIKGHLGHRACHRGQGKGHIAFHLATPHLRVDHIVVHRVEP